MCGIAGILCLGEATSPPQIEELERMAGALLHRGPDEFGLYRDSRAGLAHSRLSIIDILSGQQPLSNEDGSLWIAFNGEIFNYVELREELIERGHQFRTRSDTEVIVHAYEQWGEGAFERFNGQFAIALWDSKEGAMIFARDWAGILPLHYMEFEGRLYFGSEVKAIFASNPAIPREFDPRGLAETFTFWSIVPPQSVYRGVREVEPGHLRIYKKGQVRDRAYFEPGYPRNRSEQFSGTIEEATQAVRASLEEATKLRMLRADVPVGSYLSGGLDSSLVASLGLRAKGEGFRTFSLRFEDAEYDETEFQRAMVAHIGSDHAEVVVTRKQIAEALPEVIRHTERPILRTAPAPLYLLSKLVRGLGTKVVLTGEGADEVFAGYDIFREAKVRRFWAHHPESKCRPGLLERLYPYLARSPVSQKAMARQFFGRNLENWDRPGFSHDTRWQTTAALKRLFSQNMQESGGHDEVVGDFIGSLPCDFGKWSYLAQDQYLEIRTLLAGYLLSSQGDRMLMANSVEGRFPFLDINVVKLANSLPSEYKLKVLDEKHVVKRASKGLIPQSILARKKQPYRAPDALSFVGDDAPAWVSEMFSESCVAEAGVFEPKAVTALWSKCIRRKADGQFSNSDNMAVVGVLSTQLLHENMIKRPPTGGLPIKITTRIDRLERQE